jgi:hypothetical protein
VVVEKKGGCFSGCGSTLAILLLVGLAVKYWYLALGLIALVVAGALMARTRQHDQSRPRPGPRDPWLNEVAVALADLELTEQARNTGTQLGGVPLEGDIGLEASGFSVFVNLFATNELARQAEIGLRANPKVRGAVSKGHSAVRTVGRVVYVANGRGGVVDDFRLDEVIHCGGPNQRPSTAPARRPRTSAVDRTCAAVAE